MNNCGTVLDQTFIVAVQQYDIAIGCRWKYSKYTQQWFYCRL